jgi:hypothetical protein
MGPEATCVGLRVLSQATRIRPSSAPVCMPGEKLPVAMASHLVYDGVMCISLRVRLLKRRNSHGA